MGGERRLRQLRKEDTRRRKRENRLSSGRESGITHKNTLQVVGALSLFGVLLTACGNGPQLPQYDLELPPYLTGGGDSFPFAIPSEFMELYSASCPPTVSFAQEVQSVSITVNPDESQATISIVPRDGQQGTTYVTIGIQKKTGLFNTECETVAEVRGSTYIDTRPPGITQNGFVGNSATVVVDEPVTITNVTDGTIVTGGPGTLNIPVSNQAGESRLIIDDQHGHQVESVVHLPTSCDVPNVNDIQWDFTDERFEVVANCTGNGLVSNGSLQSQVVPGTNGIPVHSGDNALNTITVQHGIFTNPVATFNAPVQPSPIAQLNSDLFIENGQVKANVSCTFVSGGAPCEVAGTQIPMGNSEVVSVGSANINNSPQTSVEIRDPAGRSSTIQADSPIYDPFSTIRGVFHSWKDQTLQVDVVVADPTQSVQKVVVSGEQHTSMSDGSFWQKIEHLIKGDDGDFQCQPVTNLSPSTQRFSCELPFGKGGNITSLTIDATDVNGVVSESIPIDVYSTSGGQIQPSIYPTTTEKIYNGLGLFGVASGLMMLALVSALKVEQWKRKKHNERVLVAKERLGSAEPLSAQEQKEIRKLMAREVKQREHFERAYRLKLALDEINARRKEQASLSRGNSQTTYDYTVLHMLSTALSDDNFKTDESKNIPQWKKLDGKIIQAGFSTLKRTKDLVVTLVLQELSLQFKDIKPADHSIYVPLSLISDPQVLHILKHIYTLNDDSWFWRSVKQNSKTTYPCMKHITRDHLEVIMLAHSIHTNSLRKDWSSDLFEVFKIRRPNIQFEKDIVPQSSRIQISNK